ncbi:response regulator transcription factor [Paenibacillus ginsengarvi]|uniref:Response regulator n=1 Tax=Paenibacillus ginsengarvi TaxID=400777 RepID=A0A3B0C2W9_9BACL|nr:response regulator [Paenibacillus ginsengarvi]RKN78948.1 response regulator [Paenibacillus ginsengarvi]
MLNILLVDDEVALLNGLKKLILKKGADRYAVREAYDGVEALDLMREFDPDILLTDMRMPRMDGLSLIREARSRKPGLLTAVISAYSDYEYIREALLMNATDYLLKPVTAGALHELLERLEERAGQQARRQEQDAIGALLRGFPADNPPSLLNGLKVALLLVCFGPFLNGGAELYPDDGQQLSALLDECSAESGKPEQRMWIVSGERPNERFVALAADGSEADSRFRTFTDKLQSAIKNRKKPVTVVAASGLTLGQLYDAGNRMRKELLRVLVFGKSSLTFLRESGLRKAETPRKFAGETAKVMEVIEQRRFDLFADELSALMASWESEEATQYVIQQTLFRILAELGDRGLERQIDLEMLVSHSLGYAELRHHVSLLFHELFDSPEQSVKSVQVHTIVGQIEEYLKTNYRQTITLQSLSHEFGLVPNYLSVLFKRELGQTPLEYLVEFRIKEAKRMMDERPDLLLKQVASVVGYSDPLYFSRVFKKITGQSPSEYAQSRLR